MFSAFRSEPTRWSQLMDINFGSAMKMLRANKAGSDAPQPSKREMPEIKLVRLKARTNGTLDVLALLPTQVPIEFWFEDDRGLVRELETVSQERFDVSLVNRIATSDVGSRWLVTSGTEADFAESDNEAYRMAGEFTYHLKSTKSAATAELLSPTTGEPLIVQPLTSYVFRIRAATHRCRAWIIVEIRAEDGSILSKYPVQVGSKLKGGATPDDYHLIESTMEVPANGHHLCIKLQKGETLKGNDSYALVSMPELYRSAAPYTNTPIRLSKDQLAAVEDSPLEFLRTTLRVSDAPPPATKLAGNLIMSAGSVGELRKSVVLSTVESLWKLTRLQVTAGRVRVSVTCKVSHTRAPVEGGKTTDPNCVESGGLKSTSTATKHAKTQFGIFVDGHLSATVRAAPKDGAIHFNASLAKKNLDGLGHAIELRILPSNESLGFTYAILPAYLTSWANLQQHAGPPLSVSASPAAQHHLRALHAWINAEAASAAMPRPPLARLHAELLRGYQKRDVYPPLEFPATSEPVVSIVIPVHNKFEVTYHCLCSLLFAHTNIPFEVIIVDDASTDATARMETIVSGIELVRSAGASPTGFVRSCNAGADVARGQFVLFLNNDTEVTAGWLDELLAAASDFKDIGLVGAKLVYPDGRLQEAGGIVWRTGNPWNVGRGGNASEPQYNYVRQVDYASGAAIMLPRDVFQEVGGFSSEFEPGYFEDTDIAMKVRENGRRVLYVPTAEVFHFEGQTSGTNLAEGMKKYQEVNRPKFKRKWVKRFSAHSAEGFRPDLEKDRGALFRVLFIDHRFPAVDADAGSYAAFQEMRLLQSLGAKVTFLPRNLAWQDRHTTALQRAGIECLYSPFVTNIAKYLGESASDYDLVYLNRFSVAKELVPIIRESAANTKIIFNLADLHFLREMREAAANTPGYSFEQVSTTRAEEISVVEASDLTLSYSDVEIAVLQSHLSHPEKVARAPWVIEVAKERSVEFESTKDVLFLGGFRHPPNIAAVKFFAREVMPRLLRRRPDVRFRIVGSNPTPEILALASENIVVDGYVPSLDEAFDAARVFVVPLIAGAGIKGKVLEAMARGTPMVLSPIAAEGTSLSHNNDCLLADQVDEWVDAVDRLYSDRELWCRLRENAAALAGERYSFEAGRRRFRSILERVNIFGADGLHYTRVRPRYGGSSFTEYG